MSDGASWGDSKEYKEAQAKNPFADISDPIILRALVQDGVECEECHGARYVGGPVGFDCPACHGIGKVPLSDEQVNQIVIRIGELMASELRDKIIQILEGKSNEKETTD